MRTPAMISVIVVLAIGAFVIVSRANMEKPTTDSVRMPVLVELFTSEGCSSCPPADALIRKLEAEQPVANAEIIVLGEHVDYWNYIGWTDRFSSVAYSNRQAEYARQFQLDSIYTPQMVVDGREELNGSDSRAAKQVIARSADAPKVKLLIQVVENTESALKVRISVPEPVARPAGLLLAVTESGLETRVERGENGGHTLYHTGVVRSLAKLGEVDGKQRGAMQETTVKLDKGWQKKKLRLVAFLQEASGRVAGAGWAPVAE